MDEKGGMDEEEFEQYLLNSICPLYPDARDVDGYRVLIKVDSGPGRLNEELLAKLRANGFILYPGVSNTTSVTQEIDRNYGPFKTAFRDVLNLYVQERIDQDLPTTIQPWLVGMVIFGGTDPDSKVTIEKSAFELGFSCKACV